MSNKNKQTWKCDTCKTEIELSCKCNTEYKFAYYRFEKQEAIDAIKKLGEKQCCYVSKDEWPHWCDCKYGGPDGKGGEKTGCPELMDILRVVENMSDNEWDRCVRSGK